MRRETRGREEKPSPEAGGFEACDPAAPFFIERRGLFREKHFILRKKI